MRHSLVLKILLGITASVLLLILPHVVPEIRIHLATEILIYILFAVSFNLLFGYAGLLPFGHAALFGVGAYTAALIFNRLPGTPLLLTLLMAGFFSFLAGIIIGFFSVRLRGAYFALITLAFQMFLFAVALKWRSLTGGDDGMGIIRPELYLPAVGNVSMMNITNLYYLTMVIVALSIFACYLFLKTPLGNSAMCIRENDVRASFLGYNVFLTNLTIFSASGLLAGLAGGLFVLFQEFVATTCLDLNMSMTPVLMVIIGGPGHFFGPLLGAVFYIGFQDWLSSLTKYWLILMGILFVIIVLYLQDGLISLFKLEKIHIWAKCPRK